MAADVIEDRLVQILAEHLKVPLKREKIREDMSLRGRGLGLDSVDVVSLVVKLEEAFDIFFEAEEVAQCAETFGSLLRTIRHKVVGGAAPKREH